MIRMRKIDEYNGEPSKNKTYTTWQRAASEAYKDASNRSNVEDYRYLSEYSDTENAVYVNSSGDILFSVRGTANANDAATTWVPIAFSTLKTTDRYKRDVELAERVMKRYPNADITFTGHSMGGSIATLLGGKYNANVVAFNPGVGLLNETDGSPNSMITYKTYGDPVSNARSETGTTYYLTSSSLNKHSIDSMTTDEITGEFSNKDDAETFFNNMAGNAKILTPGNVASFALRQYMQKLETRLVERARKFFRLSDSEIEHLKKLVEFKLDPDVFLPEMNAQVETKLSSIRSKILTFFKNKITTTSAYEQVSQLDDELSNGLNELGDQLGVDVDIQRTPVDDFIPKPQDINRVAKTRDNTLAQIQEAEIPFDYRMQVELTNEMSELINLYRMKKAASEGKSLWEFYSKEDRLEVAQGKQGSMHRVMKDGELLSTWKRMGGKLTTEEIASINRMRPQTGSTLYNHFSVEEIQSMSAMEFPKFEQYVEKRIDFSKQKTFELIEKAQLPSQSKFKVKSALSGIYNGFKAAVAVPALGFLVAGAVTDALDKAFLDPMAHVDPSAHEAAKNAILSGTAGVSIVSIDKMHNLMANRLQNFLAGRTANLGVTPQQLEALKESQAEIGRIVEANRASLFGRDVLQEAVEGTVEEANVGVLSGAGLSGAMTTASAVASIAAGIFAGAEVQQAVAEQVYESLENTDKFGSEFSHRAGANITGAVTGGAVGGLTTSVVSSLANTGFAAAAGTIGAEATAGGIAFAAGEAALASTGVGAVLGLLIGGAAVLISCFDGTKELSEQNEKLEAITNRLGYYEDTQEKQMKEILDRTERSKRVINSLSDIKPLYASSSNKTTAEFMKAVNYDFYIDDQGYFHPFLHWQDPNRKRFEGLLEYNFLLQGGLYAPEDFPTCYGGSYYLFRKLCVPYIVRLDWVWLYHVLQVYYSRRGQTQDVDAEHFYGDYTSKRDYVAHVLNAYQNGKPGYYVESLSLKQKRDDLNLAKWRVKYWPTFYKTQAQFDYIDKLEKEIDDELNGEGEKRGIDDYNYARYLSDTAEAKVDMEDDLEALNRSADERIANDVVQHIINTFSNKSVPVYVSQKNRNALRYHPVLRDYAWGSKLYIDAPIPSKERNLKASYDILGDEYAEVFQHIKQKAYESVNTPYEKWRKDAMHTAVILNRLTAFSKNVRDQGGYLGDFQGTVEFNIRLLITNLDGVLNGDLKDIHAPPPRTMPTDDTRDHTNKIDSTSATQIVDVSKGGAQETVYTNNTSKGTKINKKKVDKIKKDTGKVDIDIHHEEIPELPECIQPPVDVVGNPEISDAIMNDVNDVFQSERNNIQEKINNSNAMRGVKRNSMAMNQEIAKRMKTTYGQSFRDVVETKTNVGKAMRKAKEFNEEVQARFKAAGEEGDRILNRGV
jgi:hypothetical protein